MKRPPSLGGGDAEVGFVDSRPGWSEETREWMGGGWSIGMQTSMKFLWPAAWQTYLCLFQCNAWHSFPQYMVTPQWSQNSNSTSNRKQKEHFDLHVDCFDWSRSIPFWKHWLLDLKLAVTMTGRGTSDPMGNSTPSRNPNSFICFSTYCLSMVSCNWTGNAYPSKYRNSSWKAGPPLSWITLFSITQAIFSGLCLPALNPPILLLQIWLPLYLPPELHCTQIPHQAFSNTIFLWKSRSLTQSDTRTPYPPFW